MVSTSGFFCGLCRPNFGLRQVFVFLRRLGYGAEGEVWLVSDATPGGPCTALKLVRRGMAPHVCDALSDEVAALQRLAAGGGHNNVVRPLALWLSPCWFALQMEYVDGGTLASFLRHVGSGALPESLARYFVRQILAALAFVHARRVAFRDLKPDNCLLTSDRPPRLLLADFGVSRHLHKRGGRCRTFTGTPGFMSPDVMNVVFLRDGGGGYDGAAADVWSCGAVLHLLLTGRHPFGFDDVWESSGAISSKLRSVWAAAKALPVTSFLPDHAPRLSPGALSTLAAMLHPDETQRPTAAAALEMPWLAAPLPPGLHEAQAAHGRAQAARAACAGAEPLPTRLGEHKTRRGEWRDAEVREFVGRAGEVAPQGSPLVRFDLGGGWCDEGSPPPANGGANGRRAAAAAAAAAAGASASAAASPAGSTCDLLSSEPHLACEAHAAATAGGPRLMVVAPVARAAGAHAPKCISPCAGATTTGGGGGSWRSNGGGDALKAAS